MASIVVRNLADNTHRALKARAAAHGRSTEAEVRAILDASVEDSGDLGLGSRIHQIASAVGGFDLDIERSRRSSEPIDFS